MRIESSKQVEHLGAVRIHDVRRLLELDSGARIPTLLQEGIYSQKIERDNIAAIQQRLAIVLPIKDEDVKVFEGVLSGVPHDCLMIIISNSQREEVDNFRNEQAILGRFCDATKRSIPHESGPVK